MYSVIYEKSSGAIRQVSVKDDAIQTASWLGEDLAVLETETEIHPDEWMVQRRALVPFELPQPDPMIAVRMRRDALLTASDWTQIADSPLSAAKKEEFRVYRQALRDITETLVDFPTPPTIAPSDIVHG